MPTPRRLPSVRSVPWAVALEVAVVLRDHWMRLRPDERARLGELVRQSKGRPQQLTADQRQELRRLVGKLEPATIGRDLLPFARRLRRRRP